MLLTLLNGSPRSVTVWATPLELREHQQGEYRRVRTGPVDCQTADPEPGRAVRLLQLVRAAPSSCPVPTLPTRKISPGVQRAELEGHLAAVRRVLDLFGNGKTAVKASIGPVSRRRLLHHLYPRRQSAPAAIARPHVELGRATAISCRRRALGPPLNTSTSA